MLPIKPRKTRIGKVWKYTYLPFQCNVEVNRVQMTLSAHPLIVAFRRSGGGATVLAVELQN